MPDELLLLLALLLLRSGGSSPKGVAPHEAAAPAAAAAPPPGAPLKPGDLLQPGASYRATIKLTGIEAMFGTAAAVKAKLEGAGFKGVVVNDQGGGNFSASGSWGGAAVPAKLPSQVVSVVRA